LGSLMSRLLNGYGLRSVACATSKQDPRNAKQPKMWFYAVET
jgi:hypothetical protein